MHLKRIPSIPTTRLWFLAALLLLALCGIYTGIFATGALLYPNLRVEQWLLHRPLTGIDCVFFEWSQFGELEFSLALVLALGIACVFLGYRRRVLPYLMLLLLLGAGVELVGKQIFPQVIPANTQVGISSLACPQMGRQSISVKIMLTLGMWWEAPPVRPKRVANERYGAVAPLIIDENATRVYGYPSGHALRWCFIGFVACWLAWRHVKPRLLRAFLMAIALAVAFGGGFAQFYIGFHLATDLIAGYLLGASFACCAIGLLLLHEKMGTDQPLQELASKSQNTLHSANKSIGAEYVSLSDGG